MPGLCLCVAKAPPPVLSVREVAAGAGGASLGLRRLRHVLDTGLSGLEPKHKGLGRRRNKGLFHAATEKLQISKSAVQAGGAGPVSDPPKLGSAALGLGSTWFQTHSKVPLPSLLLRILTTPTPGSKYLTSLPAQPFYNLCLSLSSQSSAASATLFSPPLTMKPNCELSFLRKQREISVTLSQRMWSSAFHITVGYKFIALLTIQRN